MRSAPVEVVIAPVCAMAAACVPFTKSRRLAPSYVAARCVQMFGWICVVPFTFRSEPATKTCAFGRRALVFAYRP